MKHKYAMPTKITDTVLLECTVSGQGRQSLTTESNKNTAAVLCIMLVAGKLEYTQESSFHHSTIRLVQK